MAMLLTIFLKLSYPYHFFKRAYRPQLMKFYPSNLLLRSFEILNYLLLKPFPLVQLWQCDCLLKHCSGIETTNEYMYRRLQMTFARLYNVLTENLS